MNAVELAKLESLTKDYAAFQARKSGLATALGGVMAVLLIVVPLLRDVDTPMVWVSGVRYVGLMLFAPVLWLIAKVLLGRWLYRGAGEVKPTPNPAAERGRWRWIFGISLFLVAFLTAALAGFATGVLGLPHDPETLLRARLMLPSAWIFGLPLLYLGVAPFAIRGVEEGRVYTVLVVQCCLWMWNILIFGFLHWRPGPEPKGFTVPTVLGVLALALAVIVWAALAMIRGWREHREYLAMLRGLQPTIDDPSDADPL